MLRTLKCDMTKECARSVTHIGARGFLYCADHAAARNADGHESCRKLRAWECARIQDGKTISYERRPQEHYKRADTAHHFHVQEVRTASGPTSAAWVDIGLWQSREDAIRQASERICSGSLAEIRIEYQPTKKVVAYFFPENCWNK
jgi:hypothetical protein